MNTTHDPASLTISDDNRHQFVETSIASASNADHEIRQAEARGAARKVREDELRHRIKRAAWGLLALIAVGVVVLVIFR